MKCPKCQYENRPSAKFCSECGAKLQGVCPQCGTEVVPNAKFCDECGTAIKGERRKAKGDLEGGRRKAEGGIIMIPPKLEEMQSRLYIPQSLKERMQNAAQQLEGENRLVTVMFADISGFTPASEQLSPEQVAELASRCFKAIADSIVKYEGYINRFIGDSVLAFFGAPIAHENDPERAILAAFDIVQAMPRLNRQVTIGINTGTVYLGPVGSDIHQEYTVEGHAVNLTKRLQEAAKPGQIIVGEGTYRLTRRAFEFEPLSPLKLKGISKPVLAYAAIKALPKPEKLRGIEGLKAPLIGRDEEFSKLKSCLDELMHGRGQIVSIIGNAGVGKSRLVLELRNADFGLRIEKQEEEKEEKEELKKSAIRNPQSAIWLEGRCLSIGESVSYWVFIDILKSYFKFEADDDEKAMAEKITTAVKELLSQQADEILPLFGYLLSVKFGNELDEKLKFASPEQLKHRTLIALRDFFLALAQRQPLVLVFEDFHWSDELSLDLISLLMEILPKVPLMLICVYRPEEEHESWRISSIASSKCPERYTEIQLRELHPQESRQMMEDLIKIKNLPEKVKHLILQKSEGNPFFVEEVIRSLIESGMVYREGKIWKARGEIESITVPDTIQSLIMTRIDALEDEVKYVLQCASVIGKLFSHRLLSYLSISQLSRRERELDKYLQHLEERELIYEDRVVPDLEYSFKHVLTQEIAYQSLLERRRKEFHRQIGKGIETLYRDRIEEYYEQLAYHYDRGEVIEKSVEYLLKAGEKARRAYLNDRAIGYFQRALERLDISKSKIQNPQSAMEWRLESLKGLGQIYLGIGKVAEAEAHFRQAIALGPEMGLSASELVRLYYWLAEVLWWQSRFDEEIRIGEEGLALLGDAAESVEAALMNAHIAMGYKWKGNQQKWREFNYKNAQFIQGLPYSEEIKPAYVNIIIVYAFDDHNIDEGMKWLKALERKAEDHHDLRALGEVYYYTGLFILAPKGDLRGAISQYQRVLEIFKKIGDPKLESWGLDGMARAFLSLGELLKAEESAYKEFEITKRVGNKGDIAMSYIRLGTIWLCQGDVLSLSKGSFEKATNSFQQATQLLRELGLTRPRVNLTLGRVYLAQGKRQEALKQFQDTIALVKTDAVHLAEALSGLEEAYADPEAFRAFCRDFVGAIHESPNSLDLFIQWYLEPTEIQENFGFRISDFGLKRQNFPNPKSKIQNPQSTWVWHDPFGDCSFTVQNGLEIQAANGRDLGHLNLSAPRILQPISGDFAVQTICVPVERAGLKPAPTIGGILLWKDEANFLRLDTGANGKHEISFSGRIGNKDVIIGRGRLPSVGAGLKPALTSRVFLRMARLGSQVNALCSTNQKEWFTVGHVEFSVDDPVEIGLHAIGSIDRTVYHGAYPEGTAIRFLNFQLSAISRQPKAEKRIHRRHNVGPQKRKTRTFK